MQRGSMRINIDVKLLLHYMHLICCSDNLKIFQELHGDQRETAIALQNMALLLRDVGDLEQAWECLEEILKMQRTMQVDEENHDMAVSVYAKGLLLREFGDFSQAQQHLEEALRMQPRSGYESDNRARQYLEESLGMQRTLYADKNHVKVTLSTWGRSYFR